MLPNAHLSPMANISGYLERLQNLAISSQSQSDWNIHCTNALNGEASHEVQKAIKIDIRRKYGAFFTGTELSKQLLLLQSNPADGVYHDPTCGMGDLLLAAAKTLQVGKTIEETLNIWGTKLSGTDLHSEFIAGAKIRLALLARQMHPLEDFNLDINKDYFPLIQVGDAFSHSLRYESATYILMNPPYGSVLAPSTCKWAKGKTTEAAIFVAEILENINPGTEILAILPEVLRSGSHQKKWREYICELAEVHEVKPCGVFDASADIDVFMLKLIKRSSSANKTYPWPLAVENSLSILSDYFDVKVGRVVPHRDENIGDKYPYIHAKSIPLWEEIADFSEFRQHRSFPFKPPFVVVRRTSRPGQKYRAVATLISGNEDVFVENHLIVCSPKDKSLNTCRKLMKHLKLPSVNIFIDNTIRCRHLTVGVIREIPFSKA